MSDRQIRVVTPTDAVTVVVGAGDEYRYLATGKSTDGEYFLVEAIVPPGVVFLARRSPGKARGGSSQAGCDRGSTAVQADVSPGKPGSDPAAYQRVDDVRLRQRRGISQIVDVALGDLP